MREQPRDPGATPLAARAWAPDLARGAMLLLIALANVRTFAFGAPLGPLGYPRSPEGVDRVVAAVQVLLVDGRAYPLFGLLVGYGVTRLAWRRGALGMPGPAVERLLRRRGAWLLAIGCAHGLLLFPGDIVGAYGLLVVVLSRLLVKGSDGALLGFAAGAVALLTLLAALSAVVPTPGTAAIPSVAQPDPLAAAVARVGEWLAGGLLSSVFGVAGAVALGAWAGRRGLLDEPARHRRWLRRAAVAGVGVAVLGGLPTALLTGGWWAGAATGARLLAGGLHTAAGYAGGIGYAAAIALVAVRVTRRGPGPLAGLLVACGRRSLSCYLAQSVAFAALLPAWTFGLGDGLRLWQGALLAAGVWLVTVGVAAAADRTGGRGPAETLLRRLTYGPPARSPG